MAIETIKTLVPPPVQTPRGAVWAAEAAAWMWRAARRIAQAPKPAPYTRLAHLRAKWLTGGRCFSVR